MDNDLFILLGTCISAVFALIGGGGGLIAWIKLGDERKKLQSEARNQEADFTTKIQASYKNWVEEHDKEVMKLKEEIDNLEKRIAALETELDCVVQEKDSILSGAWMLFHQVHQAGEQPKYEPPEQRKGGKWRQDN